MNKEREVYKEYEKTLLLVPNFLYRIRKLYPSTINMAFLQETLTHILNDTPRKKLNPERTPSNSRNTVLFSTMHHRFHYMGQRLHDARIEGKTNEELDAIINEELKLINTIINDAMHTVIKETLGLDDTPGNDTGTREETPST